MKEYYYSDGQNQVGPFKPEELKEKKISRETLVWCEGMHDWVQAQDVEELKYLFTAIPPPIKKVAPPPISTPIINKVEEHKPKSKTTRNIIIICISVIVVAVVIILLLNNTKSDNNSNTSNSSSSPSNTNINSNDEQPKQKTEAELKADLKQTEESNPLKYLTVSGQWHVNLVNEMIVEGNVFSSATLASFKDIKIKVGFLTKTKTVLYTTYITVYDNLFSGKSVHFKNTINYYNKDCKSLSLDVVDAKLF